MTWVRVEPDAPGHLKIQRVGLLGFGLVVAGLCYANHYLTDGFIPTHALPAVFPGMPPKRLLTLAGELVGAGLWEPREDGWMIHDFHRYQPTKDEELAERKRRHDRAVAGGVARASTAARIAGRFAQPTDQRHTSSATSVRPAIWLDQPTSTDSDPYRTNF